MQGWEWAEDGWQIDMRGVLDNSVDEEGWTYATDFSWIQWPPAAGTGRFRKVCNFSILSRGLLPTAQHYLHLNFAARRFGFFPSSQSNRARVYCRCGITCGGGGISALVSTRARHRRRLPRLKPPQKNPS